MYVRTYSIDLDQNIFGKDVSEYWNNWISFESTIRSRLNSIFSNGNKSNKKSIRIKSKVEPLVSFSNSANTNVSRSISFSLFDSNGK